MDDPNQRPTPVTPFGAPLPSNNPPSQPKSSVDLRFAPSSAPTPKVEPTRPTTPSPAQPQQPTSYKTSIRTMSDDIANLKTGQKPVGSEIEKTISPAPTPTPRQFIQESAPKPAIPSVPRPAPTISAPPVGLPTQRPAPAPIPRITIPPVVRASEAPRPQAPSEIVKPPISPIAKQQETRENVPFISPPEKPSGVSRWRLYALIGFGLVLIGAIVWLLNRGTGEVATTTPTPTAATTPTPTPIITLQSLFGGLSSASISLSATTNLSEEFGNQIKQISIAPGELKRLIITSISKGGGELNLVDLMDRLQIVYPVDLKSTLGDEYVILAYGQQEMFGPSGTVSQATTGQPRLIFVTQVVDAIKATEVMRTWETAITDQLQSLFGYTKSKAASQTFLDNTYSGSAIRYKNYSFPDRTTDYSITSASNNRTYLVIANSREGIYKVIDVLR